MIERKRQDESFIDIKTVAFVMKDSDENRKVLVYISILYTSVPHCLSHSFAQAQLTAY